MRFLNLQIFFSVSKNLNFLRIKSVKTHFYGATFAKTGDIPFLATAKAVTAFAPCQVSLIMVIFKLELFSQMFRPKSKVG